MRAWTGVWERGMGKGVGGARLHCIVKVRKPGPWMPRGEASQRQSGSSSRRTLGGSVGASETRFPLPLLPQGAGLARPQPGESACIGGGWRGHWGRRKSTWPAAVGGLRSSRPPRWYTRVRHWLQRGCLTIWKLLLSRRLYGPRGWMG